MGELPENLRWSQPINDRLFDLRVVACQNLTRRISYGLILCAGRTDKLSAHRRNSPIAQSVEQAAVNRFVLGSSPSRGA